MGIKGKLTAENRKIKITFNHFEIKRPNHTFFEFKKVQTQQEVKSRILLIKRLELT